MLSEMNRPLNAQVGSMVTAPRAGSAGGASWQEVGGNPPPFSREEAEVRRLRSKDETTQIRELEQAIAGPSIEG